MRVLFYKAKHYWKNGKTATWEKHNRFTNSIFVELKNNYIKLGNLKANVFNLLGKDVFLFYDDTKKDFSGRPTIEITTLQSNISFKDPKKIHKILSEKILNVFDDKLEYELEIDDSLINKNSKQIIYIGISIAFILFIFVSIFIPTSIDEKKKNIMTPLQKLKTSNNDLSIINPEKERDKTGVVLSSPKKKVWKWMDFCNTFLLEEPMYCYHSYIIQKCEKKDTFKYDYLEFIRQKENEGLCIDLEHIDDIKEDENLKNSDLWQQKYFFEK